MDRPHSGDCSSILHLCPPPYWAENVTNEISAEQQKITVSGKVVDVNGEPLIGAAVLEQGSRSNGVITDLDGNFTIAVNANAVLVVSSVGFNDENVAVNGRTSMTIVLKERD